MKAICLIVWMLISLVLVFSIIGLVLFIPKDSYSNHDSNPSTWYTIGKTLLDSVVK